MSKPKRKKFSFIFRIIFTLFMLAVAVVAVIFLGINNIKALQYAKECTVQNAQVRMSAGGLRGSGSSTSYRVETQECGVVILRSNVPGEDKEGTVDYLNARVGQRVTFMIEPVTWGDYNAAGVVVD